jgi:putative membrane protein
VVAGLGSDEVQTVFSALSYLHHMELRARARGHVRELTALLTVVSLALVFGAALGAVPRTILPRASDAVFAAIPHVNAVISTAAIATILLGVRAIRAGNWRRHRAFMLGSLGLFVAFLALYLYKVSIQGPAPFPGPDVMYRFVYLPTLAIHIVLAIVCLPLLYYVALLALTHSVAELRTTAHARFGRIAAALWVVSFVLGNVVYAMLYLVY